ncbi:mitochondrial carrier domain-containing protein [Linnemannia elongata]|uniref:Mitochondrial carrier n=1 Tax=Linnemannia elongata AG-77 TaxID=1314771 RepID=A0A197KF51_9FUNG|nr:mitochondrial carrier domain-containing protein [Linnemannia elongata]OAQ36150.1 mitochondrial carrier [Linnemannia elongata AG-77]
MMQQQQQNNYSYTHSSKPAAQLAHLAAASVVRKPAYTQTQKFKNHFHAGAVSLSLSYAVMHPLDTLKTRMQVPGGKGIAWSAVFTRETVRLLGKGFLISSIGAGLQGGARFSFYELTKSYLLPPTSRFQTGNTPPQHPWFLPTLSPIPATAISAIIGDLASSVIKVPREVITSRLQTGYYSNIEGGVNAGYVFRAVLREEGVRGLFRGFWSTTARDCPFMVILFTTYENFKAYHTRNLQIQITSDPNYIASSPVEVKIPPMTSTLFGGISGFLAGYFTTPMDVIRTRIMTFKKSTAILTPGPTTGSIQSLKSVVDVTMTGISREMYRQATIQAAQKSVHSNAFMARMRHGQSVYSTFFVGAIPRSLWWFCVCSIFFSTYEVMKQNLMPLDYEPNASRK